MLFLWHSYFNSKVQSSGVFFRFHVTAVIKHIIPIILSSLGCAGTVFLPKPRKWAMLTVHQRTQPKFSFVFDCKRIFCNQNLCIHFMSESRIRNSQVFQDMWSFQPFWYNKTGLSLCFSLIRFTILCNTINAHTKNNVKIRLRWGHILTEEGSSEILFSLKSSLNKQNVIKRWRVCGWGLKVSLNFYYCDVIFIV